MVALVAALFAAVLLRLIQVVTARPLLAASVLVEVQVAAAAVEAAVAEVAAVVAVFAGRRFVFAVVVARLQLNG